MHLLFVHQNFPGQFGRLAQALLRRGDRVTVLHYRKDLVFEGAELVKCSPVAFRREDAHPLMRQLETQVRAGELTAMEAERLKKQGLVPDLIVGHPGWGEMLFLKDVWPSSPMIAYPEFFTAQGSRARYFDPEFNTVDAAGGRRVRIDNTINLHALASSDLLWFPTQWQRDSLPPEHRAKSVVIHDGIDTAAARPNPQASFTLHRDGQKLVFRQGDEVITFVNRSHEPVRGFHIFMRALPEILRRRPKARVIVIGGDGISYGNPPPGGGTWREFMLRELAGKLDLARIFFVGKVPKEVFLAVMQVSALHVYLTYPFVLSWSFLEAMSCGARILASNTSPVAEFVEDGVNGRLFDFFRPDELAEKAVEMLHQRGRFEECRAAARKTIVERCDFHSVCLPAQLRLIDEWGTTKSSG